MKSFVAFTVFFALPAWGQTQSVFFNSPNGIQEECKILSQLPTGDYSKGDAEDERFLCSLDFYNDPNIALCPKTWSTSPGTMIYDISKSGKTPAEYEAQSSCGKKGGHDTVTKFKQTMNQSGTSGTFSPSSLVYYHLSRHFDTAVDVPVAVYRTMDKDTHFARVTEKAHTKRMGAGTKIRKGWEWLYKAEQNPSSYSEKTSLFTPDLKQIYGMLGNGGGEKYGAEINGVRSSWGEGDNNDFQKTPAFLALRSERPLLEAISEGLVQGQKVSKVKAAMGGGASNFQMAVWMKELTEIVILDYILDQQDRIGNIDFKWYYYWVDANGKVKSKKLEDEKGESIETERAKMSRISYPKEVDGSPTQLVQRTRINDNDAGVRVNYTGFAKKTKMLEKVRHISRKTFDRLVQLNDDLQSQGAIYQLLKTEYNLEEAQVQQIVNNTAEATAILKATDQAGKLQFDLDSVKDMFKTLSQQ